MRVRCCGYDNKNKKVIYGERYFVINEKTYIEPYEEEELVEINDGSLRLSTYFFDSEDNEIYFGSYITIYSDTKKIMSFIMSEEKKDILKKFYKSADDFYIINSIDPL